MNDTLRVLLVDDDAAIRRALRTSLNELGFHITEAARGEEAVHLVRIATFDVVLLDVQMPGMGGIKTLTSLRSIAPRLPILMVTVQDSEEQKVEALERGADDYIVKPFGVRECIARIRAVVRRARAPGIAKDAPLQIGEVLVQPTRRLVIKAGREIHSDAEGVRDFALPYAQCRPRSNLRQAVERGLGRRISE